MSICVCGKVLVLEVIVVAVTVCVWLPNHGNARSFACTLPFPPHYLCMMVWCGEVSLTH